MNASGFDHVRLLFSLKDNLSQYPLTPMRYRDYKNQGDYKD